VAHLAPPHRPLPPPPLPPAASRNADTLKRLQETEKALKERQQAEYVDMDKCAEEKEKGNAAFKEQRCAGRAGGTATISPAPVARFRLPSSCVPCQLKAWSCSH
jgi:hypothetical protein